MYFCFRIALSRTADVSVLASALVHQPPDMSKSDGPLLCEVYLPFQVFQRKYLRSMSAPEHSSRSDGHQENLSNRP